HLTFELVEILRLQLLGGVAVGAGFALGAVYQDGRAEAAADVGDRVRGAFGRLGELKGYASFVEETPGADGLGSVIGEPAGEEIQELVVAQLTAQRIEKQDALDLFDAETV